MLIQNAAVVYPRPDDLFETVQDAYFMFLIDGRDFYFQREIAAHLRPITAFQTHILAYQWKRMPQGLKPSSAAAINLVTELLQTFLVRVAKQVRNEQHNILARQCALQVMRTIHAQQERGVSGTARNNGRC